MISFAKTYSPQRRGVQDRDIQIYIAAGEIYAAGRRMASLAKAYPKLRSKTNYCTDAQNQIDEVWHEWADCVMTNYV
ncbi:hypothetical protein ACE6H2_023087 [Prunus campanulata]